ncbi:putative peptidase C1-like protein F26E4.3 [Portunus trituberculatus]|uniref:Putative peptidase C1-like protein F26E4.3 n=1 Tax=Portunus trituberculatus TaxID=210409 RepID=A0A5B7K5R3_PORTR|nr:putative peptidase C1-like protein F26E4.3 [Portunus trituberculatus]
MHFLYAQLRLFSFHGSSCEDGRLTCEEDQCLVDEELIRRMHQHPLRHGWTAANHSIFWGRKLKEGMELRTGTFLPEAMTYNMMPILLRPNPQRIPMEFDARQKWSGLISGVRDQGWCGASWAFSSLDVAQDR